MLTSSEITSYLENGYLIRRDALSDSDLEDYRNAIDRLLHKCLVDRVHDGYLRYIDGERDDIWGVNNVFHPSIREEALVHSLANPQILDVIESLIGNRLRYHLCTLLVNSEKKPYHINWHRDAAQDGEVPQEVLNSRLRSHVQLNGALYDDDSLYIVPGSHCRELTDAERTVLQERPNEEMPNQLRVELKAGDIVFYNSSILHKGKNTNRKIRQTLHYAVVAITSESHPLNPDNPTDQEWLNEPEFLGNLPDRLKPLFDNWLKYR